MKKLILIGAGNVGGYLSYNTKQTFGYNIIGFLDDDKEKWNQKVYNHMVLGPISMLPELLTRYPDERLSLAVCIASPVTKRKIVNKVISLSVELPSFVSDECWISEKVTIGRGVIIYPGSSINYETHIGDFVTVNMNCAIGHNCHLSNYSTLAPGVNLAGFTSIGECADIGIGVSTIQNIKVGEQAIVGAQSVLIGDIPPGSTVVGNPARMIRVNNSMMQ